MSTAAIRRQAALDSIARVVAGARAGDVEDELIDFKEEAGTVGPAGRVAIAPQHGPAAQALAIEVACLANSRNGGVLVVGVDDNLSGPAALVGTHLDLVWLRQRIWALTTPHASIDEIEELTTFGPRLYLINVAPAMEEIRAGGKLRRRQDSECVEISGDDARRMLEERRGFDWTAQPSGLRLSAADPVAVASARRHFSERRGVEPDIQDLAGRMGILLDDTADPELNRAGALLLAKFEPGINQLQLLISDTEGAPSRHHLLAQAPLLPVLDEALRLLDSVAFPEATPAVSGLTRRESRAIPEAAYREVLVNAVMHRDYQLDRITVVAVATGKPSDTFKVRSPGGLPPSVSADRLLATPSRPRNEAMALALRTLAIAEREGVGIKTMYRTMLREGHPSPEIVEDSGDVVVRLSGGSPDLVLRAFFDDLEAKESLAAYDATYVIAIRELLRTTPLRPEGLAVAAQRSEAEALDALVRLERIRITERLLNRSKSFRLTDDVRKQLGHRVQTRRSSSESQFALIRAFLDQAPDINRDQTSSLLTISHDRATRLLVRLRREGALELAGTASRGRDVRYRLTGS